MLNIFLPNWPRALVKKQLGAMRSLIAKEKGKKIAATPLETLIDDIFSDSSSTPAGQKLMSSGRQFAQGTIHFLLILLLLFLGRFVYLLPYAEYKPHVLQKLEMSGMELFLKRGRESMSDASRKVEASIGPTPKRVKVVVPHSPPHVTTDDQPFEAPTEWGWPPLHRYNVNVEPRELFNILAPLLLPETLIGHGPKTVDQVMIEAVGHSFHVSSFPLLVCKIFICPYVSPGLS